MAFSAEEINNLLIEEIDRAKRLGVSLREIVPEVTYKESSSYYAENHYSDYPNWIWLNSQWIERVCNIEEIRTVLAHEVAHSTVDSYGHDLLWKKTIEAMRSDYEYFCGDFHMSLNPYSKDRMIIGISDGHTPLIEPNDTGKFKYVVACKNCGSTWGFTRKCRTVSNPEGSYCLICSEKRIGKSTLYRVV